MIIEFLGPVCVGKTTLREGVYSHLTGAGIAAVKFDPRRMPRQGILPTWAHVWRLCNRGDARKAQGEKLLRSIANARTLEGSEKVVLVDEGALKIGSWFVARTRCPAALARAVNVGQIAVQVDCDPDVRLMRLRTAMRPSTIGVSDEDLKDRHARHIAWGRLLAESARIPLIYVDTTDGADHSAEVFRKVGELVPLTSSQQVLPDTIRDLMR